jgi:plasmid replication initiation protein
MFEVGKKRVSTQREQLDLFVALVGDVPLRDDREMMSAPMVSIAKRGQERIEWEGPSGQQVVITSNLDDGIATIWDFDVVIWAISQLNAAVERSETPSPIIKFRPYDLMKAIKWCDSTGRVGGRDYERFKAAVSRLRATRIRTSIRSRGKERSEDFNLLNDFLLDEKDGKPLGARMTVPAWIFRAVTESRREVLSITPLYFELTSGIDRFLYRLARRHAGNGLDNRNGWAFSFRDLHKRSGSSMRYADFAKALRRAIEKQAIPTYELIEEPGANGDPLVRMRFRRIL